MNKSKFLKKSLAMILSVLMIVAMIPLSASAAENTSLPAIFINGTLVSVSNGNVFAADIKGTDTAVDIFVADLYADETAEVADKEGNTTDVADVDEGKGLQLSAFSYEGGVYTIPLTLTRGTSVANYTIKLTKLAVSDTIELDSVKAPDAFGASIGGNRTINVRVPLGYDGEFDLTLTTKDNATVEGDNCTVEGNVLKGFQYGDRVKVVSESGGNWTYYTVVTTEEAVLKSFQAGDVIATIDHNADNDPEKAPTITAVYPASVLDTPPTEKNPPAAKMVTNFTVSTGAKVYPKGGNPETDAIPSGKDVIKYYNAETGTFAPVELTVDYKNVKRDYTVIFGTEKSAANTIISATVDGETATISGTTITATVQKAAQDGMPVELHTSPVATVKITAKDGTTDSPACSDTDDDGNGVFISTAFTKEQLTKGVVITVTSEAQKAKQYELVVKASGDVDTTALTSFALRIGGNTYTGTVTKANTVTVEVPYLTTDADLVNAKVIATTNAYVKACATNDSDATAVAEGKDIFGADATFALSGKTGSVSGEVWAVAKSGSKPSTKYTVTVKLAAAKDGNTLTNVTATSAHTWADLANGNTYSATPKTAANGAKSVTIKPTYSECQADSTDLYLKSLTTANGGVAFMGSDDETITNAPKGQLSDYFTVYTPEELNPADGPFVTFKGQEVDSDNYIIVLPEVEARKQMIGGNGDVSKGSVYEIVIESQPAKTGYSFSNIKFGTTTLSGNPVTGTLPYSLTAADHEAADAAEYIVFADEVTISDGAKLFVADENDDIDEDIARIIAGGADVEAGASEDNGAFFFERNADGTVTPYVYTDKGFAEITHVIIYDEGETIRVKRPIGTIKYAQPNTEALITAFSLAGVAGKITNAGYDNWTIEVTVPLGTNVTTLVPTFTASAGAAVSTVEGTPVVSGVSSNDYSGPVVLKVTSEDGGKTNTYTVKVTVSDGFSDVPSTAWYYNNVMAAYSAGYVSGNGNGTFTPNANVTRRDFAVMVHNMLGKPAPNSNVSFADVREEGYEVAAIAYLKENDIMSGDGDTGKFRPNDPITRQEAACAIANAKDLVGTSSTKFNDDAKIASWASAKVYACYAAGVLNGDKDTGNFRPTDNISRAEAATIVLQAASK